MTQTRNDTSVATLERCACGHRRLAHELDGIAPACNGDRCHCPRFRLGEAPVDLNALDVAVPPAQKPGPRSVAPINPPAAEEPGGGVDPKPAHSGVTVQVDDSRTGVDVGELIREGKTSPVTETVALAEKLEQVALDLHHRLDEEAEQRRVLEEIRGLEEKLAAARARLTPAPARPETPDPRAGSEAAGGHGCPDCGQVFTTARGLGRHRAWAHDYQSPSHHPTSPGAACPDCGKDLTTAGLALHRIRAHGYRKRTAS